MRKRPDYQVRLDKIRELLISGVSMYEIKLKLQNGEYDWFPGSEEKDSSNLDKIVMEALDTCQFESMAARDSQKALHLERYLDLYRECRNSSDRSNARAILSDIAKLMGLNSPSQVQVDATNYRVKLV